MYTVLQTIQIFLAVFIIVLVLIQSKGGGFASGIGSQIGFYRQRRGLEKLVFIVTIIVAILIVINSLLLIIYS